MTSDRIIRLSFSGTALFALTAIAAVFTRDAEAVATATALVLFVAGIALFFWAFAIAVGRSRHDAIGIGGLFFLAGKDVAPPSVKQRLLGALGAEVVIALATAALRPFTSLAFGILVPMFGLALAGLWGARFGKFDARRGVG